MALYTRKEFEKKQAELTNLARSVDLWKGTSQSTMQKDEVGALLEELKNDSFALECAFLDKKFDVFTRILVVLRNGK